MDPRYKSPGANVDRDEESEFRDLEVFTNSLKWMLRIGAVLAAFGLISAWMQLDLLSREFDVQEGRANDLRQAAVVGIGALVRLAAIIIFGRWIVLAHRNLPALGARYVEFTPGWALGWFFIPVAWLWKPFQAMRFLWRSSHSVERPEIQENTWVLPVWWTLWLIWIFIGNFSFPTSFGPRTIANLTTSTEFAIAKCLVDVPLYVVASLLVSRIWEAQRRQHETPGSFDPAPGFADVAR